MPGLHIAVVTSTPQPWYVEALRRHHYTFVTFSTIEELLDGAKLASPDLILFDCHSVTDNVLAAADLVYQSYTYPSIALVGHEHVKVSLEKALPHPHLCPLLTIDQITHESIYTAIPVAFACFQRAEKAMAEIAKYKQAIDEENVIERAKRILMENAGLSERDAFQRLRTISKTKKRSLLEIAKLIVLAEAALAPD